jgi:ADP-ribose pyrophosphatase
VQEVLCIERTPSIKRCMLKRFSRQTIYKGYCFDLVRDAVLWPNGLKLDRDLIVHPGVSVVIPVIDNHHLILVHQYRYGARKKLWEIPAGTICKRETPLKCAKREMEEEIGYRAKKWKKILTVYPSPGFNTEIIHCYKAYNLKKTMTNLEDDEILTDKIFSMREVKKMIRQKKIQDAKSLIPLFYFFREKGVMS